METSRLPPPLASEPRTGETPGGEVLTQTREESKARLKRPQMFRVLLHNDDYTTRDFVVFVLQSVFGKQETEAVQIMLHVHQRGIGVAGVYTYEVAETKVATVIALARRNELPLLCTMEPE